MRRLFVCTALLAAAAALMSAGCSKTTKTETSSAEITAAAQQQTGEAPGIVTTKTGLRYEDIVAGTGEEAANGRKVSVHYTLWRDVNGQKGAKIQSSKDNNEPFSFTVGQPGLIAGWNEGMLGMKAGGTRRLYIPAALGYGAQGRPPIIPPNADLIFEIELLEVY